MEDNLIQTWSYPEKYIHVYSHWLDAIRCVLTMTIVQQVSMCRQCGSHVHTALLHPEMMDADAQSLVSYGKFSLGLDLQSLAQGEACSHGKAPGNLNNSGLMIDVFNSWILFPSDCSMSSDVLNTPFYSPRRVAISIL